jgi:Fe2+ or Zn2+ uptake regulation protein
MRCGKIQDFNDNAAQEMVGRAAAKAEFTRARQRLDVYDLCKTCRGKAK